MGRRPVDPVVSRTTFEALRRPVGRSRRGSIKVAYVPTGAPDTKPQVAFSVSKRCGGAVVRNQLRRRMRSALDIFGPDLNHGAYLVTASRETTTLSFQDLTDTLQSAMRHASGDRTEQL